MRQPRQRLEIHGGILFASRGYVPAAIGCLGRRSNRSCPNRRSWGYATSSSASITLTTFSTPRIPKNWWIWSARSSADRDSLRRGIPPYTRYKCFQWFTGVLSRKVCLLKELHGHTATIFVIGESCENFLSPESLESATYGARSNKTKGLSLKISKGET
jgi:hypothetical protein